MANQDLVKNEESRQLQSAGSIEPQWLTPAVDIYENEKEYVLLADLPGVEPDAVNVHLEGNELRIQGQIKSGGETTHVYTRAFQVGPGIDSGKVSAEISHGVLKLTARKSDALQPRQIKVKAN